MRVATKITFIIIFSDLHDRQTVDYKRQDTTTRSFQNENQSID